MITRAIHARAQRPAGAARDALDLAAARSRCSARCIPPLYNTRDPELFGVPFFYWYQMVWIPVSVLVTVTVYRATKRAGRR